MRSILVIMFIALPAFSEDKEKREISPSLQKQIDVLAKKHKNYDPSKLLPKNNRQFSPEYQDPVTSKYSFSSIDLKNLMKAATLASGKDMVTHAQGRYVTSVLWAAGFTKERIQVPFARDLGKPLEENEFVKLESLNPDDAPAGSVIVMSGGSGGAVVIKGDDGYFYSDTKSRSLPGERVITGIYYKKKGAEGVFYEGASETFEKRLSALPSMLNHKR